jgi:hypothetical protein
MATEMERLSEITGIPFLFHPFPDTIVSTYQGGSAERAKDWFSPMRDTKRIIYAPIDDAENILEDRSNEGVSAGVREVIGVVLRNVEGPYAVNHGNWTMGVFTNLPEQLDPAVLSRIQKRMTIEGAQTVEDFLDQDYIWWSKLKERFPGLIDMQPPAEYDLMSRQQLADSLSDVAEDVEQHSVEEVSALWDSVSKSHDPVADHRFYAEFFKRLQDEFPFFSSRDVRNIQTAIGTRLTDFDYPEIWWEEPDDFFRQDYETKKQMLLELQEQSLGGLSFAEMRKQETLKYVHNTVRIKQTKFDQMVEDRVEELKVHQEAKQRLQSQNGTPT